MPTVLLPVPLPDFLRDPLAAAYTCVSQPEDEVRGIVVPGGYTMKEELIASLPKLEIISVFGVGYDGVPLAPCRARGIHVTNTPDVLTDDVADIASALVLMTSRSLGKAERFTRAGTWPGNVFPLAHALRGKTAGILGLGRIGKAIAQRLAAHGMKIAYHGRQPQDVPFQYCGSLIELAQASDFLIAACPGGPNTKHLINAEVLAALGTKGTVINISRGSVIDEAALIHALQNNIIRGAGLDVFENEPHVPAELLACENTVVFPHIGSATHETRRAMAQLVVDNLAAHFSGQPLLTAV
ncbi:2-hydroxyacid dehydrogenase [Brevifollis gellanilyticus]|uniref:Dihydrofolate reductase n=1 Tax=Brevifollis gellanilyticus TaxID=748831 RepID=A0A512M9M0_9BACT|nr:2-hydroxyacid dehydrogenase [Brevifollis gellanilyticus]GEP43429.1 dihydrofolate reductase [Brevifollis gellanilyticus]